MVYRIGSYNPKWMKKWYAKNKQDKDRFKNNKLKYLYKISLGDFNTLLKLQNGKCLICNQIKKLNVDHCHKTGKVRGLLCHKCNNGLGSFEDNKEYLKSALEYLSR